MLKIRKPYTNILSIKQVEYVALQISSSLQADTMHDENTTSVFDTPGSQSQIEDIKEEEAQENEGDKNNETIKKVIKI